MKYEHAQALGGQIEDAIQSVKVKQAQVTQQFFDMAEEEERTLRNRFFSLFGGSQEIIELYHEAAKRGHLTAQQQIARLTSNTNGNGNGK